MLGSIWIEERDNPTRLKTNIVILDCGIPHDQASWSDPPLQGTHTPFRKWELVEPAESKTLCHLQKMNMSNGNRIIEGDCWRNSQCCFNDVVVPQVTRCSTSTPHHFCFDCANKYAGNEIGHMRYLAWECYNSWYNWFEMFRWIGVFGRFRWEWNTKISRSSNIPSIWQASNGSWNQASICRNLWCN